VSPEPSPASRRARLPPRSERLLAWAHARTGWTLTAAVLGLVLVNLGVALLINRWNKFFFDALEQKDVRRSTLGVAIVLGLALAAAAVAVAWFMPACACS
jgi:ABC-type uncharacterized transport system fused permease/ATPase subunit